MCKFVHERDFCKGERRIRAGSNQFFKGASGASLVLDFAAISESEAVEEAEHGEIVEVGVDFKASDTD